MTLSSLFQKNQKITFKDIAGIDNVIKEVTAVVDFIKNPEKGKKMGEDGKKKAIGYSAEAMVIKIDKLYRTMLQQERISKGASGE